MVKRNHSYSVGDIEYTANDYILKCKTAGTTSLDPLVINSGGGAITDGTVEWELIKDGDMPSNIYISFPSTDSYVYEVPADGYIYGRVYRNSDGDSGNSMLGGNFLKTGISVGVGRIDIQRYFDNTFIRHASVGDTFKVNRAGSAIFDYRFYYSVNSAKELGLI